MKGNVLHMFGFIYSLECFLGRGLAVVENLDCEITGS